MMRGRRRSPPPAAAAGPPAGSGLATARDVMGPGATKAFVVQVVEPMARMLASGRWRELVLLGRWRHPPIFLNFPPARWLLATKGCDGYEVQAEARTLTSERLVEMGELLRSWAPRILATSANGAPQEGTAPTGRFPARFGWRCKGFGWWISRRRGSGQGAMAWAHLGENVCHCTAPT